MPENHEVFDTTVQNHDQDISWCLLYKQVWPSAPVKSPYEQTDKHHLGAQTRVDVLLLARSGAASMNLTISMPALLVTPNSCIATCLFMLHVQARNICQKPWLTPAQNIFSCMSATAHTWYTIVLLHHVTVHYI